MKPSSRAILAARCLLLAGLGLQAACAAQADAETRRVCDEARESSEHAFSWINSGTSRPDDAVPIGGGVDGALQASITEVQKVLREDADGLAHGDTDAIIALERAYADVERACGQAGHPVIILPRD